MNEWMNEWKQCQFLWSGALLKARAVSRAKETECNTIHYNTMQCNAIQYPSGTPVCSSLGLGAVSEGRRLRWNEAD